MTTETTKDDRPIVVGLDGSRFCYQPLRWALAEADRRDTTVRALMVVHPQPVMAAGRPSTVGVGVALAGAPIQDYTWLLERTLHDVLHGQDNARLTAEVVRGAASDQLCAASTDAQLLVVGSHGHGHLFESVLGSVAQHCVRHAACPVVVIPAALADPMDGPQPVGAPRRQEEDLSTTPGPLL